MGDVNETIRLRVDTVLNGLPIFQQFGALLEKIKSNSSAKIQVGDSQSIANTQQLATAVDNLGQKIDSLKPSKLQEFSSTLQGISAGSAILKALGTDSEAISNGIATLKGKVTELVEGAGAKAKTVLAGVTTEAAALAPALPAIGEGAGEAAVGIGALVGGAGVAIGTVALLAAGIIALIAAVALVTTGVVASVPALVAYSTSFADNKIAIDDQKAALIDSLPVHDKYRQLLIDEREATAAAAGPSRELRGLLDQLRSQWNQITTAAGGYYDQIAEHIIPILNQLLRVATHVVDDIESLINGFDGLLGTFFDFILFNIDNIGKALLFLETRAVATAKGILAAIAVGYATGSVSQGGQAFIDTFKQTAEDLDKISNTKFESSGGGGSTFDSAKDGGGRGGGSRAAKPEDTSQSQFALDRAIAEARYKALSESLDRENQLITEKYNERKISITDYYAEVQRIEDERLEAEEIKLLKELNSTQIQLAEAYHKIDKDRASGAIKTNAEADAKKTNELNKALERGVQLNADINSLRAKRAQLPHDIEQKEKADTDALNESLQKQIDAIDRLRGLGPLVDARNQVAEIDKLIEQFADNPGMVALLQEWRDVVATIGQAQAAVTRYEKSVEVTEQKIATLQEKGSRNVLQEFISQQRIKALRQEELKQLEEVLKLQQQIAAAATGDAAQKIQVEIEKTKTRIEQLKNQTKSFKQTFEDTFINSAANALENFFMSLGDVISGTKKLGDAFREMALSIIKDLEQMIAKMLVMLILQKLLGFIGLGGGGDVMGGAGNIGSIISSANPAAGLGGHAAGDFLSARPGGRLVWAAEGGHDEMIVTTDPRHRGRTQNLIASFLQRTKLFEGFDLGGWISAITHPQFEIPALAAGDWIPAGSGAQFAGASLQMGGVHFHGVKDYQSFKQNQAAIERDLARATRRGLDRFRKG